VKTTIEIPDELLSEAESGAARRGIPLQALVSEALTGKLHRIPRKDKPWMRTFSQLHDLHSENQRIDKIIEQEFEKIEPVDWK
jgi:hypothetical protein